MKYRVNKQKCVACGICVQSCPGATRIGSDGKAEVIDQDKLAACGGESVCPMGAIEKVTEDDNSDKASSGDSDDQPASQNQKTPLPNTPLSSRPGRGQGFGRGRGQGRGRGMGRGRRRRGR